MMKRDEVAKVLLEAIDEFNRELAQGNPLPLCEDASLSPGSGALDSLGFVNLVTIVESHVERRFGTSITLSEAGEAPGDENPWQSVRALVDFVVKRLDAAGVNPT